MRYQESRSVNKKSNAQGKIFEKLIEMGCQKYAMLGKAFVEKIPEDFQPQEIDKKTKKAIGYYKSKAQPDFQGTLAGGRSVCFEAKMTNEKKINQSRVTKNQSACLDHHESLGAYVGVCCQINKTIAFIPWKNWKKMKEEFGRKYITEEELKKYQVPTPMYVDFLF
ncbi:MAG: Holliday junction resolvase RecU, partial [Enterococcus lemanii]